MGIRDTDLGEFGPAIIKSEGPVLCHSLSELLVSLQPPPWSSSAETKPTQTCLLWRWTRPSGTLPSLTSLCSTCGEPSEMPSREDFKPTSAPFPYAHTHTHNHTQGTHSCLSSSSAVCRSSESTWTNYLHNLKCLKASAELLYSWILTRSSVCMTPDIV